MGIWRVTTSAEFYGQTVQNVIHFDSGDTLLTDQAVFIEVRDNWIGTTSLVGVHQWHPANIRWVSIMTQRLTATLAPPQTVPVNIPGVQATSTESYLQMCTILQIRTATPGRHGRGRIYLPGVMAGFTTNGFLDDTFTAFASAALNGLRNRFTTGAAGVGPLVVGVAPRNNPSAFHPATQLIISPITGTQRRRNIGVGI